MHPGNVAPPRQPGSQFELNFAAAEPPPAAGELLAVAQSELTRIGCRELAGHVRVQWNSRLRTTAGLACYTKNLVLLNPKLIEFGRNEVLQTLRHELAHLVARFRAGRRRIAPHGPEWKAACRDLGIVNERRCHQLPLPRRTMARKHFYRCPACAVEIERVRPFRRRVACLACCRRHSKGGYDDKFRLVKLPTPH